MMVRSAAWKMAWREARAAAPKFVFVIFGVAAGVGALTGVRGFSAAFHGVLKREARTLLAADLTVRQFSPPTESQFAKLEPWLRRGVRMTRITETVSMMGGGEGGFPILVSVKAIDPHVYPFYGEVRLDPAAPLPTALTADTIAISDDLVVRLGLSPGSTVRLGAADFRVCGVVRVEPDRMTGSINVGSRVMVTREGLERTGLVVFGARVFHRLLFKLPARGVDVYAVRDALKQAFPEAMVADYRDGHPLLNRSLERSTTFLSLVSLVALIVGALGVATAIQSHIQQRLDTIAILKCLGARSGQIIRIYTFQTLALGLAGGVAGVAVGAIVQRLFPVLLARYFHFDEIPWNPSFALEGIATGILVALLFTLPPLLAVRQVKPALIFRREMAEARPPVAHRVRRQLPAIASGALILAGLAGIAAWLAESLRVGAYFIGGLAAAFLVLAAVAKLLLMALRLVLRWWPRRLPVAVRHGMANLYRPGSHSTSVLVALGIGVMFTLTIYLVQKSLLVEVAEAAPSGSPNVFLINITPRGHDEVARFLAARKDFEGKPRLVPLVAARLVSIEGKAAVEPTREGERFMRVLRTRQVSWVEGKPDGIEVRRGAWWRNGETAPMVSVSDRTAESLKLKPGMTLGWESFDRPFEVKVAAVYHVNTVRIGQDMEFMFNRPALAAFPMQWFAAVRMSPRRVAAFQRDTFQRFPSVTVINSADIFTLVQEVLDEVALIVRFISAFAILAGAIILAATVAGTRWRRVRESAVLKTLGARRRRLIAIFSVEFAILGGAAGLVGGVLGTVFSRILLTRLLDASFHLEILPNLATVALTAALALATGWIASLRVLRQRPMEVLRDE